MQLYIFPLSVDGKRRGTKEESVRAKFNNTAKFGPSLTYQVYEREREREREREMYVIDFFEYILNFENFLKIICPQRVKIKKR